MKRLSISHVLIASAGIAALASVLASAQPATASHLAKSKFLSWNARKHSASLTLIAGATSVNHTLNFNGYTAGGMVVSVPKGYRVTVTFTNKSTFPHSAVFVAFADRASSAAHTPAFAGAGSPNPVAGTAPGQTVKFSFTAKKVGTYAIICEVSKHADFGMWDTFKVTTGKQPSIKLTAPATATPAPTASPTP